MGVGSRFTTRFAQKHQCDLSGGVKSGQQSCKCQGDENGQMSAIECAREDLIFGPKACGDEGKARKCQTACHKSPEGDRHLFAQTAHKTHVLRVDRLTSVHLAVLHTMDHGTRVQEEQCFKKGVSQQMECCRYISAHPKCSDHVT
ncbi:hypothetical protein SDC9_177551 [bioreactor metagenome]|uniref:Uncharacterized protein n=1 Tax=bioreactor metagenome TaxID=1076179 RepID=A0A645H191_9ZZZZ